MNLSKDMGYAFVSSSTRQLRNSSKFSSLFRGVYPLIVTSMLFV